MATKVIDALDLSNPQTRRLIQDTSRSFDQGREGRVKLRMKRNKKNHESVVELAFTPRDEKVKVTCGPDLSDKGVMEVIFTSPTYVQRN